MKKDINQKHTRLFVFFTMMVFSMAANSIAPLMTSFQGDFNVSVGISSAIPFLNTIGVTLANIIGSLIIAQLGLKTTVILAISTGMVGCIFFVTAQSFYFLILGSFFIGAGVGGAFMSLSSIYAHLREELQNFGLFHAFFGIGGIIAPFIVSMFLTFGLNYRYVFFIYFMLLILLLLTLKIFKIIENKKYETIKFKEAFGILSKSIVFLPILIFMLYAGTEIGIITWSGNLFEGIFDYSKEFSSLILSAFWIVFTIGRILSDFIDKKFGTLKIIFFNSLFVILSIILLLITKQFIFFILTGIFLAPIFPILQKFGNKKLPKREVGLFNGLIFGSTGIGSMIITTSMGIVADFSLYLSFIIPIFTFLLINIITRKIMHLIK